MPNNDSDDSEVKTQDGEQEEEETNDDEGTDEGADDEDGDDSDDSGEDEDKTDWKAEALKYKAILDRKSKKPEKKTAPAPASQDVDVDSKVQAALDKRDLDALDVSDDIKAEIKNYAKLHKVSVLAAAKSSYITFLKGEAEKKARSEDAATGTKRKTQPVSNFKDAKPEDFDLSTEQGRKDWEAYRKFLNSQS